MFAVLDVGSKHKTLVLKMVSSIPQIYFAHCPTHPNPLVQQIGKYTLAYVTNMYRKYKRPKHILL